MKTKLLTYGRQVFKVQPRLTRFKSTTEKSGIYYLYLQIIVIRNYLTYDKSPFKLMSMLAELVVPKFLVFFNDNQQNQVPEINCDILENINNNLISYNYRKEFLNLNYKIVLDQIFIYCSQGWTSVREFRCPHSSCTTLSKVQLPVIRGFSVSFVRSTIDQLSTS